MQVGLEEEASAAVPGVRSALLQRLLRAAAAREARSLDPAHLSGHLHNSGMLAWHLPRCCLVILCSSMIGKITVRRKWLVVW